MKHRLSLPLFLIVSGLALFPISVMAGDTNALETLRQSFQKQEQALQDGYGKALASIMADLKKKGDLENVLILQDEQKRFDEEKTVPSLSAAKDSFRSATETYYKSMVVSLGQYRKVLDELIKQKVTADRIDEAKVVKAEKDKVEFMLADMQTQLPPPAVKKGSEPNDTPTPQNTGSRKIDIKSATYGAGNQRVDVKRILLHNIKDGTLEVQVGNTLFGDAAPGVPKTLTVEYTLGNVTKVIKVNEGEMLTLQNVAMPQIRGKPLSDSKVKRRSGGY